MFMMTMMFMMTINIIYGDDEEEEYQSCVPTMGRGGVGVERMADKIMFLTVTGMSLYPTLMGLTMLLFFL